MTKIRQEDAKKDPAVDERLGKNANAELGKLAGHADYHGMNEVGAARAGQALMQPLVISDRTAREIPDLPTCLAQFELYKTPLTQTWMSLGRVNDLTQAGAPRTPAQVPPKTVEYFQRIDNVDRKDAPKATAANQWIDQQDQMSVMFGEYIATRHALEGALEEYKAVQEILLRRQLDARRRADKAEVAKIEQTANTLADIVKVSAEAISFAGALEGTLMGVEESYAAERYVAAGEDEVVAPTRKYGAVEKLNELAKGGGGGVGLKELFIWATGDKQKYDRLMRDIESLTRQMGESEFREEQSRIRSANEKLLGVKLSVQNKQRAFSARRGMARDAAQTFGQAMGGREQTIAVSLVAEAYQELDLFGTHALAEGRQTDAAARPVWAWLNADSTVTRFRSGASPPEWHDDVARLATQLAGAHNQEQNLEREVPIWKQTALAWRHFMSDVMGKSFDK